MPLDNAGKGVVVCQTTPFPEDVPCISRTPQGTTFWHKALVSAFHADAIGRILLTKGSGVTGTRSCLTCIHSASRRQDNRGQCFLGYSEPEYYPLLGELHAWDPALRLTHKDIMHASELVQAAIREGGGIHDMQRNKKVIFCTCCCQPALQKLGPHFQVGAAFPYHQAVT
jgi:hypothetical protein